MADDRDDFSESAKRLLAERVGFHCSNPTCSVVTIWAAHHPEQKEYVGVAAHIHSASPDKGPRANPLLTRQQRTSIENGIHLCNKCSREIDNNNGVNHPATLLKDWKRHAEMHQRARGITNNAEPIYREVNYDHLDTEYKVALVCAGLGEKQIKACPRDVNLEAHIRNQMTIANKCVIVGPSGSGKSLLTHQIAEVFQAQGFTIIQLNKSAYLMSQGRVPLPTNAFLIIDDGHTLPDYLVEHLFAQATDTTKILMNWNQSAAEDTSNLSRIPQAKINETSQVALLARYCADNKNIIADHLRQMGIDVNPRNYHDTIEYRIERAAQESSPWLFNYSLSEGWKSAKQDLELLESLDKSHQVIVVIAIFQIVTLDEGVSWSAIETALMHYSNDPAWSQRAINHAKPYVNEDNGLVKLKHYRYAERLLIAYFKTLKSKEAHAPSVQFLENLLRNHAFAGGHPNLLEFISFNYHAGQYFLSKTDIVADLTTECITPDVLPRKICIQRIYSLVRFNKEQCISVLQGNDIIEKWIIEVEANHAIALYWMINSLVQAGYNELTVSQPILLSVFEKLSASPMKSGAFFAKIFAQLVGHGGESAKNIARDLIEKRSTEVNLQAANGGNEHWYFAQIFCCLSWISDSWSRATFKFNADIIAGRFNDTFFEAAQDYGDVIKNFFGVISAILRTGKPYRNKSLGKLLCSKLNPAKIASSLQQLDYHNIQDYWNFLLFIDIHDARLLNSIVCLLDLSVLQNLYGKDSIIEHHHRCLLQIIYSSNPDALIEYAPWLMKQLDEYHVNLLMMFPDDALQGLESGKRLDLNIHIGDECLGYLDLLKAIEDKNKRGLVQRILTENKDNIAKSIFSGSSNIDRNQSKIELILFSNERVPELYNELFNNSINLHALFKKIPKLMGGTKIEKKHAKLYLLLVETYFRGEHEDIKTLKARYPSLKQLGFAKVK